MALEFKPRGYQTEMQAHMHGGDRSLLFVEMGLGKTAAVLHFIADVIREDRKRGRIRRFLVVAPRKVAHLVWRQEAAKWVSTEHLRIGLATGAVPAPKRKRVMCDTNLDVVLTNYENVKWLCATFPPGHFPFYGLICDEVDKLKSASSDRFKVFQYRSWEFGVRVGMTGTPAPEGELDMFGPQFIILADPVLDPPKLHRKQPMTSPLGPNMTKFKRGHFKTTDFNGWKHKPLAGTSKFIADALAPFVYVARAKDHLDLPELVVQVVRYELPPKARELYQRLEKELKVHLELGASVVDDDAHEGEDWAPREAVADSAAVLKNKLRQVCSGFIYTDRPPTAEEARAQLARGAKQPRPIRETTWLHKAKFDAYHDLRSELGGEPLVTFYGFQAEVEALKFSHTLSSKMSEAEETRMLEDWNAGRLPELAMHPASGSHGLNLQDGGHHLAMLDLPWSRGMLDQSLARLRRMGQRHTVFAHYFVAENTVEEDVVASLESKGDVQEAILRAVQRRAGIGS